jgi:hypothetical protein
VTADDPTDGRGRFRRVKSEALLVAVTACLLLIVGIALRAVAVWSGAARYDADEAVTGVMAQRILNGDHFVFFAGQDYMGALEQYLQAAVLAISPDTIGWLRVVPFVLSIGACVLVYIATRGMGYSRWVAVVALGVFACGPYYSVVKGVRSHGAYASTAVLCLLLLVIALCFDPRHKRAAGMAFTFGLVAGVGLWQSLLVAYALIPASLWIVGSARGRLRSLLPIGLGGAILGALPLLASRASNGTLLGDSAATQPATTFTERIDGLLDPVAAMFLGAQRIASDQPVMARVAPAIIVMVALGVLGAALWQRRRGLWHLITLRTIRREPVDILILSFPLAIVLYGLSSYTWYTGEPRYLFTLYPALAIGSAIALTQTRRLFPIAAAILLVGLIAFSAIQFRDSIRADGFPPVTGGGAVYSEDSRTIVDEASRLGLSALFADYWLAYPLQFAAGSDLVIGALTDDRFPQLRAAALTAHPPAGFATPQGVGAERMAAALSGIGVDFRRRDVARATLFYDLSRPVGPDEALSAGACALAICQ